MSIKLPRWIRAVLLIGAVVLATGAGLFAYRYFTRPITLTIAVGSIDGEAAKLMSAMASQFALTSAPVRLKVIDSGTTLGAADAFSADKVDLPWFAATLVTCPRRKLSSSSAIWSY